MSLNPLTAPAPEDYQVQLQAKVQRTSLQFKTMYQADIDIFPSPPTAYRMRAEFRVWQDGDQCYYAMFDSVTKSPLRVDHFPAGSARIQALMPALLQHIHLNTELRNRLYQVEFLTTLNGEALVTLIYHRQLDEAWMNCAQKLEQELNCGVIGRYRRHRVIVSSEIIHESLCADGIRYHYLQTDNCFTQPNARICEDMIGWVMRNCPSSEYDLLELYCGGGNFTVPLATKFRKVLATEVVKHAIEIARQNFAINNVGNTEIVRLSSSEIAQALKGTRQFRRLQHLDLDSYKFDAIFLDPPRSGLDSGTLHLAKTFDNMVYISCNPETMFRDLSTLLETHIITRFALFDQFPYTAHRECGAILRRK